MRAELNETVDLMPAQRLRGRGTHWYRGTADAVYQNLDIVQSTNAEYIVVLAGDHVYKMDCSVMLADHVAKGASCTVGCIGAAQRGLGLRRDGRGRRAPHHRFPGKARRPTAMPGKPESSLASMGIYIFNSDYLTACSRGPGRPPTPATISART